MAIVDFEIAKERTDIIAENAVFEKKKS